MHFFGTTEGSNNAKLMTSNTINLNENTTSSVLTLYLSSVVASHLTVTTITLFSVMVPSPTATLAIPPSTKNIEIITKKNTKPSNIKKSYVQISKINILPNIKDVLWIKEVFSTLSADKVGRMIKAMNSSKEKKKLKVNITTRGPLRKQVIISMVKLNTELIINSANLHISNINNCLKSIKSDIITDFIQSTNNGIVITMNKLANTSNLNMIKKYVKNIQSINSASIESPCLLKSRSYLKIVGLPYTMEQGIITPNIIKGILKKSYLFKDVILVSK